MMSVLNRAPNPIGRFLRHAGTSGMVLDEFGRHTKYVALGFCKVVQERFWAQRLQNHAVFSQGVVADLRGLDCKAHTKCPWRTR